MVVFSLDPDWADRPAVPRGPVQVHPSLLLSCSRPFFRFSGFLSAMVVVHVALPHWIGPARVPVHPVQVLRLRQLHAAVK